MRTSQLPQQILLGRRLVNPGRLTALLLVARAEKASRQVQPGPAAILDRASPSFPAQNNSGQFQEDLFQKNISQLAVSSGTKVRISVSYS